MGDIREKDHWVRRTFSTCNFSFILRGAGEFQRKGQTWKIEAPCVLTQWPNEAPKYGPLPASSTWDEVYLIYDSRSMSRLRRRGFVVETHPVWKIHHLDGVMAQIGELRVLAGNSDPASVIDQVDRLCERLILESLLPPKSASWETGPDAARLIEARMRQTPAEDFDLEELALTYGMSPSSLRRQWRAMFSYPPAQHLLRLRLQEAQRHLVETNQRIGEVAALVGFADVLYFSRRFRLATGLSPTEYRSRFRLRPG